jgi:hypothetical protein
MNVFSGSERRPLRSPLLQVQQSEGRPPARCLRRPSDNHYFIFQKVHMAPWFYLTGVTTGALLSFTKSTTNFAGLVLLLVARQDVRYK